MMINNYNWKKYWNDIIKKWKRDIDNIEKKSVKKINRLMKQLKITEKY